MSDSVNWSGSDPKGHVGAYLEVCEKRDAALAALDRVRALCDEADDTWIHIEDIRAALDGPHQTNRR